MNTTIDTFRPGLFAGKTVAITGGGTGIGLVTAKRFAELGANVSICGRRLDVLEKAKSEIGGNVVIASADVKKPEELAAWRDKTLSTFKSVEILVCNAGANFLAPAATISPNGFATVVGTVLLGTWNTIHAWYPHLAERNGSSIVMNAATNGYTASPLMAHSGAGKAGMINLTQSLAVEWAPLKIRVNSIAPGPVDTEGANSRLWSDATARERVSKTVPLARMGTSEDCAGCIVFLCTPAASFITGTVVTVDGGNFLKPLPALLG